MKTFLLLAMSLPLAGGAEPQDTLLHPSFEQVAEETGLPVGWDAWHIPSWRYSMRTRRRATASEVNR